MIDFSKLGQRSVNINIDNACSPDKRTKVMTPVLLKKFKDNVNQFAINVVAPENFNNPIKVNSLLQQFK